MCPKFLKYNLFPWNMSYGYKRLWVDNQCFYSVKIKKKKEDNSKYAMTAGLHKPFYQIMFHKTCRKYDLGNCGNVLRIYCSGRGHTSAITVPF